MIPYFQDETITLYHANCLSALKHLPDESVHCCVTSPPYWGLRAYGTDPQVWGGDTDCEHDWMDTSYRDSRKTDATAGEKQQTNSGATGWRDAVRQNATCLHCGAWSGELGLEPTPNLFVAHLVEIFREVRRVLRADGTLWLNLGDSYAGSWGNQGRKQDRGTQRAVNGPMLQPVYDGRYAGRKSNTGSIPDGSGLKPKDLIGIPWRVAFALQEAGWWLRSDIIWQKNAPMPESVTDRPTRSHEYIFLLAKSERYFYDAEAIKEPSVSDHGSGNGYKRDSRLTYSDGNGARGSNEPWKPGRPSAKRGSFNGKTEAMAGTGQNAFRAVTETRNKRDVWTVNTAHMDDWGYDFERAGYVDDRGVPRKVSPNCPIHGRHQQVKAHGHGMCDCPTSQTSHFATFPPALILPCVLAGCPVGGTVLDPFSGAGTTALVAKENGRNAIGIELNEDYLDIAARRLSQSVLAF